MKLHDGSIQYNKKLKCYGMMGLDGKWIKESLEDGDRIRIMLGTEIFETKFSSNSYSPSLDPLPIHNWEFITGKPAAYYEFEISTKKAPMSKQEENKFRLKLGLGAIAISIAFNALIGFVFALLFGRNEYSLFSETVRFFEIMYVLFGAGLGVGGLLMFISTIPINYCIGFGCVYYYGTIFLGMMIRDYFGYDDISFFVASFILMVLLCYIFLLKQRIKETTKN
jgi:hypothetical protein